MANKRIITIEKKQIEGDGRIDLIYRSLTLGLADLGYPNLSINRLPDTDLKVCFEISDKSDSNLS